MGGKVYKYRWQYIMIFPGVVLLFLFNYIPMAGIQVAFRDVQIGTSIWSSPWIGLDNFTFLQDPQFLTVVKNTLINEVSRPVFKRFVQSVSYLPHFFHGSLLPTSYNLC